MFAVQKTLVEAWTIVANSFVDPAFNGTNWQQELSKALTDASHSETSSAATTQIGEMLNKLGDPFTRWTPRQ